MKKLNTSHFILFISFLVLNHSCTIQKRTFNRGYHVEWKSRIKETKEVSLELKELHNSSKTVIAQDITQITNDIETEPIQIETHSFVSEEIHSLSLKENKLHLVSDDTIEMYRFKYKNESFLGSEKDVNDLSRRKTSFELFLLIGSLFLIISAGLLFSGLNSVGSSAAIFGVLFGAGFGVIAVILLLAGLFAFLSYITLLKKMIAKHNAIFNGKSIEITPDGEKNPEINPHSKRNGILFLIVAGIAGLFALIISKY